MNLILAILLLFSVFGCASTRVARVSEADMQWAMPMRIQDGKTLYYLAGRGWFFEDGVILRPEQIAVPRNSTAALHRCEPRSDLCG